MLSLFIIYYAIDNNYIIVFSSFDKTLHAFHDVFVFKNFLTFLNKLNRI